MDVSRAELEEKKITFYSKLTAVKTNRKSSKAKHANVRYAPHSVSQLGNLSRQGIGKAILTYFLLTSNFISKVFSALGIMSYNFSSAFLRGRCSSDKKLFTSFIASSSNIFRSSFPMHSEQPTLLVPDDDRRGDFLLEILQFLLVSSIERETDFCYFNGIGEQNLHVVIALAAES